MFRHITAINHPVEVVNVFLECSHKMRAV
jgi:hypothetical protein